MVLLLVSLLLFIGAGLFSSSWNGIVALVLVILIHEVGHYVGMRMFGYRDLRMFFIPFFGAAVSGKETNVSASRKAIVALLGPIPGIVFGIISGAVFFITRQEIFITLAWAFLFINVLNLLPIHPFDGGRVLELVLFGRHPAAELIFKGAGVVALLALAYTLSSIGILIFAALMLGSLRVAYAYTKIVRRVKRDFPDEARDPERIPPPVLEAIIPDVRALSTGLGSMPRNAAVHAQTVWRKVCEKSTSMGAGIGLMAVYLVFLCAGIAAALGVGAMAFKATGKVEIERRVSAQGGTRFVEVKYVGAEKQSETELDDQGLFHGHSTAWHLLGGRKMEEGDWVNGYLNGMWQFYDRQGNPTSAITYEKGRPVEYLKVEDGLTIKVDVNEWPDFVRRSNQTAPRGTSKPEVLEGMMRSASIGAFNSVLDNRAGQGPAVALPLARSSSDDQLVKKLIGTWHYMSKGKDAMNLVMDVTYKPDGTVSWSGTATDKSGIRNFSSVGTWRVSDGYLCTETRDSVFTPVSAGNKSRELLSSISDDQYKCWTSLGTEQTYCRKLAVAASVVPSIFELRLVDDAATADTVDKMLKNSKRTGGRPEHEVLHVQKTSLLDRKAVFSAVAEVPPSVPNFQVRVTFTDVGRDQFAEVTRKHVGKRLAILVDGEVLMAPRIQAEIRDGVVVIAGDFTAQEATALAIKINGTARK